MATKKTNTKAKAPAKAAASAKGAAGKGKAKAAPKAKAGPKPKAAPTGPRHPRGRVLAAHGSKEALAKSLAPALARGDEDSDAIAARLKTASNKQLLRLSRVTETVKQKWGSREKLIAAIGAAKKKGKDQDFLKRLESYSLPQLVDLATSATRQSRA